MACKSPKIIHLNPQERKQLQRLANSSSGQKRLVERAQIILLCSQGFGDRKIAQELGVSRNTVRKWRSRFVSRRREKPDAELRTRLEDADRVGPPAKFEDLFWVDLLALASSDPRDSGLPITDWTHTELAAQVVACGGVNSIHPTTVGRFLNQCELKPHRAKGWLNRKDDPEFETKAREIKETVVKATTEKRPEEIVVSFDEKTGMQAKERLAPDILAKPGQAKRLEFQYKRHGTLVLFAFMILDSGLILTNLRDNRTNVTTSEVLGERLEFLLELGYQRIVVTLDQLNTHCSLDLVSKLCELCSLKMPEAKEIDSMKKRKEWLSKESGEVEGKKIVFKFTPKHASWLNPVERWFGVLVRKVLRRGSFKSTVDLEEKVLEFVNYYNEQLAHPYTFKRWRKAA